MWSLSEPAEPRPDRRSILSIGEELLEDLAGSSGMMVLLEKHVHLQKEVGAIWQKTG